MMMDFLRDDVLGQSVSFVIEAVFIFLHCLVLGIVHLVLWLVVGWALDCLCHPRVHTCLHHHRQQTGRRN